MDDIIRQLYQVILSRRQDAEENSYTAYLFREGLDKILKKVGEEASETIIAAKTLQAAANGTEQGDVQKGRSDLSNEVCDLLYHLLVLLVDQGIGLEEVEAILAERAGKAGNRKAVKQVNKNS
jgi:phosphoribosyl-ATP pyrophosphohydrolase